MKKTKELNLLFNEWRGEHKFDIFCEDGIVDENEFGKDIPKIVFLLKDANVDSVDNSFVCKNLLDTANGNNSFGKMWKVLCMWTMLIKNKTSRFSDCCDKNRNISLSIRKYLKKIAVVNLSKEHGKGVNKQEELDKKLEDSVEHYYDMTRKELDTIDPDIVICCGTYQYIRDQYDIIEHTLPSGAKYFMDNNRIFLEMYHPGSYLSYQVLFAYFKEVYSDFNI